MPAGLQTEAIDRLLNDPQTRAALARIPQALGFAPPPRTIREGLEAAPRNFWAGVGLLPGGAAPRTPPGAAVASPVAQALRRIITSPEAALPGLSRTTRFDEKDEPEMQFDDTNEWVSPDELDRRVQEHYSDPDLNKLARDEVNAFSYGPRGEYTRTGQPKTDAIRQFLSGLWTDRVNEVDAMSPEERNRLGTGDRYRFPRSARHEILPDGTQGRFFDAHPTGTETGDGLSLPEYEAWLERNRPPREPDTGNQFDLFLRP